MGGSAWITEHKNLSDVNCGLCLYVSNTFLGQIDKEMPTFPNIWSMTGHILGTQCKQYILLTVKNKIIIRQLAFINEQLRLVNTYTVWRE